MNRQTFLLAVFALLPWTRPADLRRGGPADHDPGLTALRRFHPDGSVVYHWTARDGVLIDQRARA